jgi:alpha-galactosidase
MSLTRREMLRLAAAAPIAAVGGAQVQLRWPIEFIANSPARIILEDGSTAGRTLQLRREWDGRVCTSRLKNVSETPARVREVVLLEYEHGHPDGTALYGEGFQMLSQTGGTVAKPVDLGNYTDVKHYRLFEADGSRAFFGVMTLSPTPINHHVLAFTSCRRFVGKFRLYPSSIQVVIDAENLEIAPGEEWELEEFAWNIATPRVGALHGIAERLQRNHPRLKFDAPPAGWCSWYCFGPSVTAEQVLANLDVIARDTPGLKYIQIDDGYQPAMGDWLETGAAFGGNVQTVLKQIRAKGFEPAIWVAPFIAEAGSRLFKEHPDWFVKDASGQPLRADKVTFGGWRRGPWYAVDGTHPEAKQHLTHVFRTMREEWGCTYFKLDANFWGAIHGGRFFDPRATRVEAYRRGMEAVLGGARDAFILGCNHPIWPSLGLIHGSRSSNDIRRTWARIETTARQNLMRNWQNGTLWWNDPDAIVLTGELPEEEFRFHASAIYATGGMILSGDDLTTISAPRLAMLKKLQPPTGQAARFEDDSLQVGTVRRKDGLAIVLLNWDDQPRNMKYTLDRPHRVHELWTDADFGTRNGASTMTVPAHGGRVLLCTEPRTKN